MTAPTLGRLLISHITLRGPELRQVYRIIAAHPGIAYAGIVTAMTPAPLNHDPFALNEATLAEAVNFLLVAGLIAQDGPARRRATFRVTPLLPDTPFALLLLHHLLVHADPRQRALALIQRQLSNDDTLALTLPDARDRMERGPLQHLFAWTGEKVQFWGHLAGYLGVVRRLERSAEVLIIPQPDLALAACDWALRSVPVRQGSLSQALDVIDRTFFACYTARGRVHRGLTQTLLALEHAQRIQLTHSADAARSLLLGERRVSDIRLLANGGAP